jgi:hypothetical protein
VSRPGAGETTIRHQESRHNHEAGVSSVNVFYDLGEDRGRGVADVSDGRAVEDHPSQLRPGPGHHGRARARTIGSTVWPCGNSFAIAVSMPGRLPPLLPPGRSARHPLGQRAAALATMSYLPAGLQWFFRLLAIMRSLVVHFQVGGALLEPDIFRRSRRNAAARHEAGAIGGGGCGDRYPGQGLDRRAG